MKDFNLEQMYLDYLRRVSLKEIDMLEEQRRETRLAFMGGVGSILQAIASDQVADLGGQEFSELMNGWVSHISDVFQRATDSTR